MPIISVSAPIPGISRGVHLQAGFQTGREKQADRAAAITEAAERDRAADTVVRATSSLDDLIQQDALARFRSE